MKFFRAALFLITFSSVGAVAMELIDSADSLFAQWALRALVALFLILTGAAWRECAFSKMLHGGRG